MPAARFHPDPPFGAGAAGPAPSLRPPGSAPPVAPAAPGMPPRPSPGLSGAPISAPNAPRPPAIGSPPAPSHGISPAPRPPLPADAAAPKIRALEQKLGGGRHEDNWQRSPNATGTGAIHVKSFHCKLTGDALENLDRQINEWLDAHPQYEVKFVSTSVGDWTGKLKEPNLIVQVWV